MKRVAYQVNIDLQFDNLTLEETHNLEVFMEGLTARDDWGTPVVHWKLKPIGHKEFTKDKKVVTAKKLLEIEKDSAGKPCGKQMRVHIVDMHYHQNVFEHMSIGGGIDYARMPRGLEVRMEMVRDHQDNMFPGYGDLSTGLLEEIFNDALERYRLSRYEAYHALPAKFVIPGKKEPVVPTKRSLILETA